MTLASGGNPIFLLVVHQPASPSLWPSVQSLQRGLHTNSGVTMWCVCGCSRRDVCVLQKEHSGDGCDLASTLCMYDLFVLSWARVRRVRREVYLQNCCRCIPFSTILVVIPGSPGLESSVLVSSWQVCSINFQVSKRWAVQLNKWGTSCEKCDIELAVLLQMFVYTIFWVWYYSRMS